MFIERAKRTRIGTTEVTLLDWRKQVKNKINQYSYYRSNEYSDDFFGRSPVRHTLRVAITGNNYDQDRDALENYLNSNREIDVNICNYKTFKAFLFNFSFSENVKRRGYSQLTLIFSEIEERRVDLENGSLIDSVSAEISSDDLRSVPVSENPNASASQIENDTATFHSTSDIYFNGYEASVNNFGDLSPQVRQTTNFVKNKRDTGSFLVESAYLNAKNIIDKISNSAAEFKRKHQVFIDLYKRTRQQIQRPPENEYIRRSIRIVGESANTQIIAAIILNLDSNAFITGFEKLGYKNQISSIVEEAFSDSLWLPSLNSLEASKTNLAQTSLENVSFPNAKTINAQGKDLHRILLDEVGNANNYQQVISYNQIPNAAVVHGAIEVF